MLSFYLTGLKKIFSVAKKVLLVAVVFFVVISLFMYFINQDKPKITYDPIQKNREEIYKVINDPKLKKTKEGKITIALYRAMMCGMVGEACSNNPSDGDKNFNKSIFGFMTNLIVLPYANPPASGVYWAYSGLQNAGFIPKSYAAEGIGFAAIKPFANLWKIFRDVSYMLLVLVLIAIGFMVMFRMKLNPQTVISVESALPKIVIALLLITFSFPIAGFLIDLMYVIIALGIAVLGQNTIYHIDVTDYQQKMLTGDGGMLFDQIFLNSDIWGVGPALFGLLPNIISISLRIIIGSISYILLYKFSPGLIGDIITGDILKNVVQFGGILKWVLTTLVAIVLLPILFFLVPVFLSLLIYLTALFVYFRIFFILFTNYIQILLLVIFSPIIMLFEAIPGRNIFSFWFKNLFANLLTFPLVVVLIIVSTIIVATPASTGSFWQAPFLHSISPNSLSVLVGIGILFLIPDFIKIVKEFLGAKGLPFSLGLGTFFAGAGTAVGGGVGMVSQIGSLKLGADAIKGFAKGIGAKLGVGNQDS